MESIAYISHLTKCKNAQGFLKESVQQDFKTSRIGGFVTLPLGDNELPKHLAFCSKCGSDLVLVLSLWTTYSDHVCNRIVYLFCCSKAAFDDVSQCSSHNLSDAFAWKAIRVIFPSLKNDKKNRCENDTDTVKKIVDTVQSDDWLNQLLTSSTNEETTILQVTSTEPVLGTLCVSNKECLPAIQIDFVDVEKTNKVESKIDTRAKYLAKMYEEKVASGIADKEDMLDLMAFTNREGKSELKIDLKVKKKWEMEAYETDTLETKLFNKFQAQLELYPSQILRYCFSGKPCWANLPKWNTNYEAYDKMTDKEKLIPPPCKACHGLSTFEFQVMPNFFYSLRTRYSKNSTLSKFLTHSADICSLLIFSCSEDCSCQNITNTCLFFEEPVAICHID